VLENRDVNHCRILSRIAPHETLSLFGPNHFANLGVIGVSYGAQRARIFAGHLTHLTHLTI
jgi:hypothetical protein